MGEAMPLCDGRLFALNGLGAAMAMVLKTPGEKSQDGISKSVATLFSLPESIDIAAHIRLAQFEGLNLILEHNNPSNFIGSPDYSTYYRFHRLAMDYAANCSLPAVLPGEQQNFGDLGRAQIIAMDLTLAELVFMLDIKGVPKSFARIFAGNEGAPGWFEAFFLFLAWRIKSHENLRLPLLSSLQPAFDLQGINEQDFLDLLYTSATALAKCFEGAEKRINTDAPPPPGKAEIIAYVTERLPEDYPPPAWMLPALHQKEGFSLDVLVLLMQSIKRQETKKWLITAAFREKIAIYKRLVAGLGATDNSSLMKAAAFTALQEGRAVDAELYLQQAGDSSEIYLLRGDLQYLQSHFLKAIEHFQTAAALLPPDDDEQMLCCLRSMATAMTGQEKLSGEEKYFNDAVGAYRDALELMDIETGQAEYLELLIELGEYILDSGRRAKGTDRLEQAIIIFEQALALCPREDDPAKWSNLQHQLGISHMVIGNRMRSTEHWSIAAAYYLETLKERTQEKMPSLWAGVQFQLATVLRSIGEQEKDTDTLHQAVNAYQNALLERNREKQPGLWSEAKIWLAKSQRLIGELNDDMDFLHSASSNYEAALGNCKPEQQFGLWLEARLGLARANRLIASSTADQKLLKETQASLNKTLQIARPKAVPWQIKAIETELDQLRES